MCEDADLNRIPDLIEAWIVAPETTEEQEKKADAILREIAAAMPKRMVESLKQLADHGPVHDGDVPSKADRGYLIRWKLASRCLVSGEWGFTACTYLGGHVMTAIEELTISRRCTAVCRATSEACVLERDHDGNHRAAPSIPGACATVWASVSPAG